MKKTGTLLLLLLCWQHCFCWGFYGHRKINYQAVFLLPPQMMVFYKPHLDFIAEHATDPDKRRYAVPEEAPRHFIDMDHYGAYPYADLPRSWTAAVAKYSQDSLQAYGIVPWWIPVMLNRLTNAFREKNAAGILKYSAELGHYIADAHVPLHASSNHNGQLTNQQGIHGFWESRVPELLAETDWDFFMGKATYISVPSAYTWARVLESAAAADTVLQVEKELTAQFPGDQKYAFENRNGVITRQYSATFTRAYDARLKGMVERRMQQSIYAIASFWYTAWVNAGQPNLQQLSLPALSTEESAEFDKLNEAWKKAGSHTSDHE